MRVIGMVVALALLCAMPARADEEASLPAFHVRTPDNISVESHALTSEPQWLLVYVNPGCRACDTLMRALPKWKSSGLLARVTVVVGGPAADAKAWMASRLPEDMATLRWFVDDDRQAWTALELQGAPVLFGVKSGDIEWQLAGVLGDPAALESVVRSWVER